VAQQAKAPGRYCAGKTSSIAQKIIADQFKAKNFKANYPNGSKYDGWIVFPK